ncbi:hypothetical protein [Nocardia bovistercoris]|uniref:Heavy-metal-associated domain-containing protein n=1 Tax=Nocardia bovistercoris TaxID=2785916 RepID=A0A931I8K7_9NOCA|nr:hypothetical protein [Nocardia bovistercoris]MBH0776101.1 hypothetical protein [Nocardia bovistercoris]
MSLRPRFVAAGVLVALFGVALGIGALVGDPDERAPGDTGTPAASGLSAAASGYRLTDLTAPAAPNEAGTLRLRVLGPDGAPLTRFATQHEKKLHLIVVRSDTTEYRHAHPRMDADGLWSVDWTWAAPGTYRVFADFVPETPDSPGDLVLSETVTVTGDATPRPLAPISETASVDGYQVTRHGELDTRGGELRFTVSRGGFPVSDLEPYLGANGHLVALRAEDLAYLHVHPQTDGSRGPDVTFHAKALGAGRYRLYLDFAHGGSVHTAEFTVDARVLTDSSTGGDGVHTGGGHP